MRSQDFKLARHRKGLTLQQIANLMGLTKQMIHKMETSGWVPAEQVLKLSEILAVRPSFIRPDLYPSKDYRRKM